ncbi:NAD(P)-binding protein [Jackrogersella minutella]|nr:NAD(P)-binding protein [Jackrogersella minutella]
MSKPWILVSPASRGIGHALTRHLLRTTTAPVLATARADLPGVRASILDNLTPASSSPPFTEAEVSKRLHLTQVDVTQEPSLESASAEASALFPTATHHLRLAFALPGVLHAEKSPREVDYADALHTLQVNALGPLLLMKWFGSFLPRRGTALSPLSPTENEEEGTQAHATFLAASARVGSTSDNGLGGWYTYRASKAAVNSLTKTFDLHLRARCAGCALAIAYHPGTVRTDLSREFWGRVSPEKLFSPEYAVERMLEVVRTRTVADRGRCWDWRGQEVLP